MAGAVAFFGSQTTPQELPAVKSSHRNVRCWQENGGRKIGIRLIIFLPPFSCQLRSVVAAGSLPRTWDDRWVSGLQETCGRRFRRGRETSAERMHLLADAQIQTPRLAAINPGGPPGRRRPARKPRGNRRCELAARRDSSGGSSNGSVAAGRGTSRRGPPSVRCSGRHPERPRTKGYGRYRDRVHSAALPCMSYSPQAFGS